MLHLYRSFVDGNLSGKPISWREVHNALGREFRHDRHSRFYDFRRMMAAAQARERDHHAARSIQALHRGSSVRTGIHKDKTVTVLQARHRGNAVRAQHQQKLDAAVRIQASHRGYIHRQVAVLRKQLHAKARTSGQVWSAMDRDGDGEVTKAEFARGLRQMGIRGSDHKFQMLHRCFDVDNDGTISWPEMSTALEREFGRRFRQEKNAATRIQANYRGRRGREKAEFARFERMGDHWEEFNSTLKETKKLISKLETDELNAHDNDMMSDHAHSTRAFR